ncbi:MAG TPA: YbgC/FadM family acyl-CoA thioesterase [Nitrospiria bacterium]|nr:YbgC/FadM family acyl-CoA thioesterase [Nitrospiria bacterium]
MAGESKSHLTVRIYYEDTDCGGVVYYANYLRYLERARTEHLRERGIELGPWAEKGLYFVVTRVEIDYKSPACYSDLLNIETFVRDVSKASLTFSHTVRNQNSRLTAESIVVLACVSNGRPRRIPEEIVSAI